MKKSLGFILLLGLSVGWSSAAWAESVDAMSLLKGDYIGVGGINMKSFSKSKLYPLLMDFFKTDKRVSQALTEIDAEKLVPEKIVQRIIVGIPTDVEKSEHVILWEATEDLNKHAHILAEHTDFIDTRTYQNITYFATKRENECVAILDNVLVLGSELRVKEILDAWKSGYRKGPKSAPLLAEIKRADKGKDVWFAFALTTKEQQRISAGDPLIDMTSTGQGVFNFGDLQNGVVSLDFSKGLSVNGFIGMKSKDIAAQSANILMTIIQNATTDDDVRTLGYDSFLSGIAFSANKADVRISVVYDQTKFDQLIATVTQLAKGVSNQTAVVNTAPVAPKKEPVKP